MSSFRSAVIGNDRLISSFISMVGEGRLPHAIILSGPEGSGRLTLAKELARLLACTGSERPCGLCAACRATDNPDITVVTPEKNEITVSQVRDVRAGAYVMPNQSAARVFIIPDAQLMNETAQNALLKVLEEPPQQVYFILTCEYQHQLLDTVVSRAVGFGVSLPEQDEACDYLCRNYPEYSRSDVLSAVERSTTVGAALQLLDGGNKHREQAVQILSLIDAQSELELLRVLLPFARDRKGARLVIQQMLSLLNDALAAKVGGVRRSEESAELQARFGAVRIMRLIEACENAVAQCDSNISEGLLATHFCACLRRAVDL